MAVCIAVIAKEVINCFLHCLYLIYLYMDTLDTLFKPYDLHFQGQPSYILIKMVENVRGLIPQSTTAANISSIIVFTVHAIVSSFKGNSIFNILLCH